MGKQAGLCAYKNCHGHGEHARTNYAARYCRKHYLRVYGLEVIQTRPRRPWWRLWGSV